VRAGRATALLLAALLCACGSSMSLPAPDILSVAPNRINLPRDTPAAEQKVVRISLDVVIPVHVDYGREQVSTDAVRVWIGSEEATVVGLEQDGTLTVSVPAALDEGTYDVRVVLSDGREGVRPAALTIVIPGNDRNLDAGEEPGNDPDPAGTPDAGVVVLSDAGTSPGGHSPRDGGTRQDEPGPDEPMRSGDVTGFELDALGDQQQGVPFLVTVRAMGPRAAHFQNGVEVTLNKKNGIVSPLKLGPFDFGLCVQLVTVDAKGANVKLTVTDAYGAQGTSNGFKVQ
jgi:hypothetical protein